MRLTATYQLGNVEHFKKQACAWASQFKQAAVLLGNTEPSQGKFLEYDMLVGVGLLSKLLQKFNLLMHSKISATGTRLVVRLFVL